MKTKEIKDEFMTKSDLELGECFIKEIENLIAKRRKVNKYEDRFYQDDVFNEKSKEILYKYLKYIKDKTQFRQILGFWISMMEENGVESYIICGLDGVLGTLVFDIMMDKSIS